MAELGQKMFGFGQVICDIVNSGSQQVLIFGRWTAKFGQVTVLFG